jgi:hypothetical protein
MPADGEFLEYKNHLKTSKKWNNWLFHIGYPKTNTHNLCKKH